VKGFLIMKIHTLLPVFAALTFAVAIGGARAADIKLPPETVKLRPSPLTGYTVATQKCGICHSADYVAYQPPSMTQAQWTAEMAKMQHAYGAPISDDEVKQIGAYLAVAYGSAKATDPEVIAASTPPVVLAAAAAGGPDAKPVSDPSALLTANGCLACHAIDHKIVGPGYHDVAAKYKGDAQALAKVSKRIKEGGSGKWGTVPMPPFPGLSDADVRALAEYVLKQ
jgi:cytochrome c551/c552